ncbi:MAG: hypothetical protein ACTMIR_15735, partial [Cellulomonadaceae bacterium]
MAIFEIDANRPSVVHPLQPARSTFDADAEALVTDHLQALLGEPVFPISRGDSALDEPYLTALDASGSLLVVELMRELDGDGLVAALRRGGRVLRSSPADIASSYPGGPEAFESDFAAFRSHIPMGQLGAVSAGGARMVLMCST